MPFYYYSKLDRGDPIYLCKKVPERDSNEQMTDQVESPRRILRTREASPEDALASASHFFASVNGQNQVVTLELPEEIPTATAEGATAITSTVPTTSATTTITGTEVGSTRTFLPNGTPSRPTTTATCRPQTWIQHVSEGWKMVHPQMALVLQRVVYLNLPY